MKHATIPFLLFTLVSVPNSWGQDASEKTITKELIRLEYFLAQPSDRYLSHGVKAAETLATDPRAQTALSRIFEKRWITGTSGNALTLSQFSALAEKCAPFGSDDRHLVALLATPQVPSSWSDSSFRKWLRTNLPVRVDGKLTTDILLNAGHPLEPTGALNRYGFLIDVVPAGDIERVKQHYDPLWTSAAADDMPAYHRHLSELGNVFGKERFGAGTESERIRHLLGNRLYSLPAANWPPAVEVLIPLVQHSDHSASTFLTKVVAHHMRANTPVQPRAEPDAEVLRKLADPRNCDPRGAFGILKPDHDVNWFRWLHQEKVKVLQPIHTQSEETLLESYLLARKFSEQGHFVKLFPEIVGYYYLQRKLQTKVFIDLLRPRVRSSDGMLILDAARAAKLSVVHREALARDTLDRTWGRKPDPQRTGDGLLSACPAENAPPRLQVAIDIYIGLVGRLSIRTSDAELTQHISRDLLGDIVRETLELLRLEEPPTDQVVRLLEPLARHLELCRQHGANTARSGSLITLEGEISKDVAAALAGLPSEPPVDGELGERDIGRIEHFVQTLSVSLRLRTLVARALGQTPRWVTEARLGLRNKVFGLDKLSADVGYWPPATTRFRARMLNHLDAPLRQSLQMDVSAAEQRAFWTGIYLPLARVHGMLRTLRELRTSSGERPVKPWPHLAWVHDAPSKTERDKCLLDLFTTLDTKGWLDAEDAVHDLAVLHIQSIGESPPWIWEIDANSLFAGHWSVNCNLRVYKRLLDAAQPRRNGGWKLRSIAVKVVEELAAKRLAVGPTFPREGHPPPANEDPLKYARWAEVIVTAAEWQTAPFLSRDHSPTYGRLMPSGNPAAPFRFVSEGDLKDKQRRVNPNIRWRLVSQVLMGGNAWQSLAPTLSVDELCFLVDTAIMLPNHSDNLHVPQRYALRDQERALDRLRDRRQEIYTAVYVALGKTKPVADRIRLFRRLMLLEVSNRSGGELEPAFADIKPVMWTWAANDQQREVEVGNVLEEMLKLQERLLGGTSNDLKTVRALTDHALVAMIPPRWLEDDSALRNRNYTEQLNALSETRVANLLRLRRRLNEILVAAGKKDFQKQEAVLDLRRVFLLLDLADYTVWYTRPGFKAERYLKFKGQGGDWWPALVMLAWINSDLQRQMLSLCDKLEVASGNNENEQKRIRHVRGRLFRLNESVFATMKDIIAHPDAERMLNFDYEITCHVIDFRLLIETTDKEIASARSLARNGFEGVLINVQLATQHAPPSDELVMRRIFGPEALEFSAAPPRNPAVARQINLHIDSTAKLAAHWSASDQIPAAAKAGATSFLRHGATGLLDGARTPRGVLEPLLEILKSVHQPTALPEYRDFYDAALTEEISGEHPRFSASFYRSLAKPFFSTIPARANGNGAAETDDGPSGEPMLAEWSPRSIPQQKELIAAMLDTWRTTPPSYSLKPRLAAAFHHDFGRVLVGLVYGFGRPDDQVYIFAPAHKLQQESGVRIEPPIEFLELVNWWFALAREEDRDEVRQLFAADSSSSNSAERSP